MRSGAALLPLVTQKETRIGFIRTHGASKFVTFYRIEFTKFLSSEEKFPMRPRLFSLVGGKEKFLSRR